MGRPYRSKTIATWLALTLGGLGVHRWYLHGPKDLIGWMHPWPTLLGLWGVYRMQTLGQDDQLAWVLIPLLGLSLTASMLNGIVIGLTPDPRWYSKFNPGDTGARPSGWAVIFGIALCLMLGAGILMSTIAFSGQRYFESQLLDSTHSEMRQPEPGSLNTTR